MKLILLCPGHLFVFIKKRASFNLLTINGPMGIVELDFGTWFSKDLEGLGISFAGLGQYL